MLLELAIGDAYGAGFEFADQQINDSISELIKDCIAFSGDVDTVATIALAAASCSSEIIQDLPEHLVEKLENLAFGRDYIIELDKQLMSLVVK